MLPIESTGATYGAAAAVLSAAGMTSSFLPQAARASSPATAIIFFIWVIPHKMCLNLRWVAGRSPTPQKTGRKLRAEGLMSSTPAWIVTVMLGVAACAAGDGPADSGPPGPIDTVPAASPGRGFPALAPWVSFYGTALQMGDLDTVAATFRIINIDADPDAGNFTTAEIRQLKAGGRNRVISYFNLGSCEHYRSYWATVPAGFVSCEANHAARRGSYAGYPDEEWMDVGDTSYQRLLLDHVAPRLVSRGVDGFFFDNFEIVEHGPSSGNGPCSASCRQGGLDLIRRLRAKYPDHLFVMQNATSDITRLGVTGGLAFTSLLDGISHEEVYAPAFDSQSEAELIAWSGDSLRPGRVPFFVGTEDYVGSCGSGAAALAADTASRARGFSPYATDASGNQAVVCYWGF